MPPQARAFRVIATVEARNGAELRHTEIRRSIFDPDLISDLDRFWRIARELAAIHGAIARLRFYRDGRAEPVCMRDPPFEPNDATAERDRAATMLEAIRKLTSD
jgi:hypothetical protein